MKIFRLFFWLTFLTGILYPLLITLIAQGILKSKADGSFIVSNGKPIGSSLIGQKFTSDNYFWGRPSAIDYNPLPSGGSNLSPTSALLKKQVEERKQTLRGAPTDLLFASGSGVDPHISIQSAYFQMKRISQARRLDSKELAYLIENHVTRQYGFFGERYVNVLLLNLSLDKYSSQ